MTTIKHETINNKELVVVENEGLYTIIAYVSNVAIGSFSTRDKEEAIYTYQMNIWEMAK